MPDLRGAHGEATAAGTGNASNAANTAASETVSTDGCAIVLVAMSHPALGDIGIDDTLFAVGRTETPFDGYPEETVADLSRRHARIFCEGGMVHVADMGSKNGTAVNGIDIRQKTAQLQDGDELRFGRQLSYRVRLQACPPQAPLRLVSLTLEPQPRPGNPDAGLEQIVVRTFPFLVSKTEATFARYREQDAQQLNYLSRRHAHVFLRRGRPFVEDLGSTNGTFVNGKRLDEHAMALNENDTLAFGGHHFVYTVGLQQEAVQLDPTLTRYAGLGAIPAIGGTAGFSASQAAVQAASQPERTTFIVAPDSFLDIFCVDLPPPSVGVSMPGAGGDQELARGPAGSNVRGADSSATGASPTGEALPADALPIRRWPMSMQPARRRVSRLLARFHAALPDGLRRSMKRAASIGAAVAACTAVGAATWYVSGAADREMKELIAAGRFRDAAALSASRLRADPEDASLRTLATDAWLKAYLPPWLSARAAHDPQRADTALAALRANAATNPGAAALIDELALIGWLERTVDHRLVAGAPSPMSPITGMPIRLFVDEDRIAALLAQWERDPAGHQLRAAEISAAVPAFRQVFAGALSDLRRLQSDSAVSLAAIARLKTGIGDALAQDRPDTIVGLIAATAEKAPRLTGLDAVRDDVRRILSLERAQRNGRLGPLVQAMQGGFVTPPFQERLAELVQASRLPPAPVVAQMRASADAWTAGDVDHAQALLDLIRTAPWAQAAASESAHRRELLALFAGIATNQRVAGPGRGASAGPGAGASPGTGAGPRTSAGPSTGQRTSAGPGASAGAGLLLLAERLDPAADAFLLRLLQENPGFDPKRLASMAETHGNAAQQAWQQYRDAGAIDPADLQQENVSQASTSQAALLASADTEARLAQRDAALLANASAPALMQTADAITLEVARLQGALHASAAALPPMIVKARIALLDGEPAAPRNRRIPTSQ